MQWIWRLCKIVGGYVRNMKVVCRLWRSCETRVGIELLGQLKTTLNKWTGYGYGIEISVRTDSMEHLWCPKRRLKLMQIIYFVLNLKHKSKDYQINFTWQWRRWSKASSSSSISSRMLLQHFWDLHAVSYIWVDAIYIDIFWRTGSHTRRDLLP